MNNNLVYYYCREDTFLSIINNQKLWLTSIWDLNDPSEIHWTFQKVWQGILPELQQNLSDFQRELLAAINREIDSEIYKTNMYYIICFSKEKDLLSQWRGYADDGRGYSIGINLNKITGLNMISCANVDYKKSLGYSAVIYDPTVQHETLLGIFKQILNIDPIQGPFLIAIVNLLLNAVIFKNPYYFEEKEVRLVFAATSIDGKISNLDQSGMIKGPFPHINSICETTHIELDLMKCDPSGCIEEIILGPKNTQSIDSIYQTVIKNGFKIESDKIINSKGLYR